MAALAAMAAVAAMAALAAVAALARNSFISGNKPEHSNQKLFRLILPKLES